MKNWLSQVIRHIKQKLTSCEQLICCCMVPIQANVAQLDLLEPFVICFCLTYLINYKNDFVEGIFSFPSRLNLLCNIISTLNWYLWQQFAWISLIPLPKEFKLISTNYGIWSIIFLCKKSGNWCTIFGRHELNWCLKKKFYALLCIAIKHFSSIILSFSDYMFSMQT